MRTALTVAGSDSIGGAGVQVDIKAMSVVGIHATSVITAVTAQNTQGVDGIFPMPVDFIQAQLESVLKDCDIKAVKTGMLYSAEIVETVADILEDHEAPLIVDPVMISGTGCSLCEDDFVKALKKKLLPICELVTPNMHEAETLAGMKIRNEDDITLACELIGKQGSSVLFKGGHLRGPKVVDYLYLSSEFNKLEYPRLNKAGHGSGCCLSAYITANMAKGLDIVNAVIKSRDMIQESIASQYAIGKGDVVVNPMVKVKGESDKFKILDSLDSAASRIIDLIPNEFVPKAGMNIAYALKDAAGPEEIAAIDKRMVVHNGILKKNGPAKFGAAEGLSYILLEIMKHDPKSRCIMNLAYRDDIIDIMEEVGMTAVSVEMSKDKISEATKKAVSLAGKVPDAIVDKGSKKDRTIRIIARNPELMMEKLDNIL
ncbi:bifunctional hydroxymethylpyrimidine kinase/phosphomethylpyrimidine kinase [Methanomassiliicoccales archaeon LGM-RCC1]|nr:bifunctional hydroxymethylpyrimidine kinase/phosphomethylpyrimidine kinase [Candidatus Methanomethylophilaceae archaeon]WII07119.1 bifunctional hydroxymethylpyrimidine kinase/phosphomethylpyrimidine kinase [Methanomassiliicoccales archaeon LGM-RCC1]